MTTFIIWGSVFLFVWTVAAILYFFSILGEKHRKISKRRRRLEFIFLAPVGLIAVVAGFLGNNK